MRKKTLPTFQTSLPAPPSLRKATLKRVVLQRDKLEEELVGLREENERLKEELLAHALCGARIAELTEAARGGGEAQVVSQSPDIVQFLRAASP